MQLLSFNCAALRSVCVCVCLLWGALVRVCVCIPRCVCMMRGCMLGSLVVVGEYGALRSVRCVLICMYVCMNLRSGAPFQHYLLSEIERETI